MSEPGQVLRLSSLDTRIPQWRSTSLVERQCPFCGNPGNPCYVRPDSMVIQGCPECRCFFVAPAPKQEALDAFYRHYSGTHRKSLLNSALATSVLGMDPLADFRIREISSVMNLAGKRVLDVGCGYGRHLVNFKKMGAEALGIDVDEDALSFAADRLGLAVQKQSLADLCDRGDKFDLIWLCDFIEHPLNPTDDLLCATRLLNLGGILFIWSPNATFCEQEKDPVIFRVDLEHMQYLSARTCCYLAEKLDLELIHLETVGYPSFGAWEQSQGPNLWCKYIKKPLHGAVKQIPGLRALDACRLALKSRFSEYHMRGGKYHLACILKKS